MTTSGTYLLNRLSIRPSIKGIFFNWSNPFKSSTKAIYESKIKDSLLNDANAIGMDIHNSIENQKSNVQQAQAKKPK